MFYAAVLFGIKVERGCRLVLQMGGNFVDCLWQIAKEGIFDLIVHFHSPVGAVIFHGDGDRGRGGSCIFRDTGNEDFICPGKPSPCLLYTSDAADEGRGV